MKRRIDNLPTLRLTADAFAALPEYSATYPTGTTPGKRWKRLDGAHDRNCPLDERVWMVLEYGDVSEDGKTIEVRRFRPIIQIPAAYAIPISEAA